METPEITGFSVISGHPTLPKARQTYPILENPLGDMGIPSLKKCRF
jgi:hypothetical protein